MSNFFSMNEDVYARVYQYLQDCCIRCNMSTVRDEWDHPEDFSPNYFFIALGRLWYWDQYSNVSITSFQPLFKTREDARCASKTFTLPCKVVKLETPVKGTSGTVNGVTFKWALSPKSIKVGVI